MDYNVTNATESKFDGGLLGLIGTEILCGFLCVITLGIATPWVVCIYQRWIAKHTIIDGRRMKFDGTGGQLIGNWIKWYLLTIVTCGIYSFWLPIKIQRWITKHTHLA